MKKYYVTTAIDYVNNLPHIGTAYEKIGADVLARFKRMEGFEVRFQMGSDEHSVNVFKAAKKQGLEPKAYCDRMRKVFEETWRSLNISYDDYIQTTEERHKKGVEKLFATLYKSGDIYKALYKGWYCESCEAFYTEKDLKEGLCPNHQSKPKWLEEENYFFKLSKYEKRLFDHIKKNPHFIQPDSRRNEILQLVERGLQDISISRASQEWGIPLPMEKGQSVYVWFDALINYITAIGYPNDPKQFKKWWPADCHVIGKDITRFHCVIWPAMLLGAKIPLPKTIFGHGFVYLKGEKMSKTLGNVVTPMDVVKAYGADALRYYLLSTSNFGQDGDFRWEHFIYCYNGRLANGLGNLASRTLGMVEQYLNGEIKIPKMRDIPYHGYIYELGQKFLRGMRSGNFEFHNVLDDIWNAIRWADQYISEHAPWKYKGKKPEEINRILYGVAEVIRVIAICSKPFLPETAEKIWQQFGFKGDFDEQCREQIKSWDAGSNQIQWFRGINETLKIQKGPSLFPRIEPKEIKMEEQTKTAIPKLADGLINIEDFAKLDIRVAEVIDAERVEGADRLFKLQINLGIEKRQIVAGIAKHYAPEDLVGKKIVVVANLKPATIRGVESNGMLLAASGKETISILTPLKDVEVGSRVK